MTTPKSHASETRSGGCPMHFDATASAPVESTALGIAAVLYGAISYVVFVAVFLYLVGFVSDFAVPRSIDRAGSAPVLQAVVIDVGLVTLFALQHSVMARPG